LNHLLAGLNAWQFNERLGRLEQSLQQLELINGTTLSLLQKIVSSIVPDSESSPKEPPSIVPDNEVPAKEASSVAHQARRKAKRSRPRIPRRVSPPPVFSNELPLDEPSSIVSESDQQPKEPL